MTPEERQQHIKKLNDIGFILMAYRAAKMPLPTEHEALTAAISALEREGRMEADRDFWLNLAKSVADQIGEIQRSMLVTVAQRAVELKKKEDQNG